jgi:hypothetical protein
MFPIQALSASDGIVPNAIPRLAPGAFTERSRAIPNAIPRLAPGAFMERSRAIPYKP